MPSAQRFFMIHLSGCLWFLLFGVGGASPDQPVETKTALTGGFDPETREDLRRGIEERNPDLDLDTKRQILQRIEETPKLRCTIEAITVYTDGIVCRATVSCELPFDCRHSLLGRSFSPVCIAHLFDSTKNKWAVPPYKNRYQFGPLTEKNTVLIPRGKTVTLIFVDQRESPRPVRLQPPADGKVEKPSEFGYLIASYSMAYTLDLRKSEDVYMIGRGKASVEWIDGPVPPGKVTAVVEGKERQP